jgi:mannose-6-phosphate isomerase-like protein (cupin superfamily)
MSTRITGAGYSVRRAEEAPTVPCPCGESRRIVTAADGLGCSFHITEIFDSVRHYHRKCSEVYYVLSGTGRMELNGDTIEISPGMVVTIETGTRHRLMSEGGIRTVVFGVPAFDSNDEYFD